MHLQTSTLGEAVEAKLLIPRVFFISHYVFLLKMKKTNLPVQTSVCQPKKSENFFFLSHPHLMNLKLTVLLASERKGDGCPSNCLQQSWHRERLISNCCRLEQSDWGQWSNPMAGLAPNCPWFFSSTIFIVCPLFWGFPSVSRQVWKEWKNFSFKSNSWILLCLLQLFPSFTTPWSYLQLLHIFQLFFQFHSLSCHFHVF